MTRTAVLLLCVLCLTLAHKDKNSQIKSIYEPFTDVPQPEVQKSLPQINEAIIDEKKIHDHENLTEEEQQQYEELNEMLGYGLVFGTLLLACMLMKTCTTKGRCNRQRRHQEDMANQMTRVPMLNKVSTTHEIRHRIQWHKAQIKKLENEGRMMQEAENKMVEERKRQEQALRVYYEQVEMNQVSQPRVYYAQNFVNHPQQCNYYENVPVGRPIPRDNDSSFASEYPTI